MRNIHKDKKNVSVFNENKTTNIFIFEIYTRKRGTSNSLKQKIKNKKLKTKNLSNRLKMQISIDVSIKVASIYMFGNKRLCQNNNLQSCFLLSIALMYRCCNMPNVLFLSPPPSTTPRPANQLFSSFSTPTIKEIFIFRILLLDKGDNRRTISGSVMYKHRYKRVCWLNPFQQ
jgi:hypothetical protein